MKIAHRFLISTNLLALWAGTALAQPMPMSMPMPMTEGQRPARIEKMHERMAERHSQHLITLKSKLQLQTSQDAAWNAFAQAMQPPAKHLAHPDRAALEKLTTPERIDQMLAFKAQRDELMQKHAQATKTFYGTLTAEQKKTFDVETAHFMNQRMGRGMGQGMGQSMPYGGPGQPMPH